METCSGIVCQECDIHLEMRPIYPASVCATFQQAKTPCGKMEGKIIVKNPSGTSKAWDHFGFYKIGNQILKDKAVCKICRQECKYTGGTSNLNQHLLKHHSEIFRSMPSSSGVKKSIQSQITSMMKKPIVKISSAAHSCVYRIYCRIYFW